MTRVSESVRRQVINFSFFKVMPEWRRLPIDVRRQHRAEAAAVMNRWTSSGDMNVLAYSLVGLRGDADLMLWRICYSLECLQEMTAEINHTPMAGYMEKTMSLLGTTRHSQYLIPGNKADERHEIRGAIRPGGFKYLTIFPIDKTRNWYSVPFEARQQMVREHLNVNLDFPDIRMNLIYSFGMDDQEFVMALESDHLDSFLNLAMRIRETDNSSYIARETPCYTCVRTSTEEMLEKLG